jgi:hypothetical protein
LCQTRSASDKTKRKGNTYSTTRAKIHTPNDVACITALYSEEEIIEAEEEPTCYSTARVHSGELASPLFYF